jgi:hypothetical protein
MQREGGAWAPVGGDYCEGVSDGTFIPPPEEVSKIPIQYMVAFAWKD